MTAAAPEPDPASVDRILAAWSRAIDAGHGYAGRAWYPHTRTEILARLPGVPVANALACAACLAPRVQWSQVLRRLPDVALGERGPLMRREFDRARLALVSPSPASELRGPKTRDFFCALLGSGAPVVDVWATRVAAPEFDGKLTTRRYGLVRAAYVEAARILDESPSVVQATTWIFARGRP